MLLITYGRARPARLEEDSYNAGDIVYSVHMLRADVWVLLLAICHNSDDMTPLNYDSMFEKFK